MSATLLPRALRPGSRVALIAPAGPLAAGAVEDAVEQVRSLGWEPVPGTAVRGRHGFLAAPDECRLADLDAAFRADDIDAIWCLRGGYGTMRILDRVDWSALRSRPRPLIGFSDNTALHLAGRRAGVITFHGPHAAAPLTAFSRDALLSVVGSPAAAGELPFPAGDAARAATVAGGAADGPLIGGNLALLCALLGTPYAPDWDGAVLFVEEVGEPAYRIDRMLSQLLLAGVFRRVAAVALGAFSECPDLEAPELPTPTEVIRERLGRLGVPVADGFPFGHVDHNLTLPLGVRARLDADAGTLSLLEPAVRDA
jgi:muramoyltetrapeptide carboxypeptidase